MVNKKYPCELCGFEVPIRSTIKTGENKGKKTCGSCKNKSDGSSIKNKNSYKLKPYTKKTLAKRKEQRKHYPAFFKAAIVELGKSPICVNCGCKIDLSLNPVYNIAHILPKMSYKSVAVELQNYIILCAAKDKDDGKGCHEHFDNGYSNMLEMPCFEIVIEKFKKFKGKVTENGKLFRILAEY